LRNLNPFQKKLYETLAEHLRGYSFFNFTFLKSLKRRQKTIFLITGKVGRGKTAVVKFFLDEAHPNALVLHQDRFIRSLFDALGSGESLGSFAQKLFQSYKVIFIDEFQIRDVVEGTVLITVLIELAKKRGAYVILTGNTNLEELKAKFKIFPELFKRLEKLHKLTKFFHLEGNIDYRSLATTKEHYFEREEKPLFQELFNLKTQYQEPIETKISLYSREWIIHRSCHSCAYITFRDGFEEARSMADYQELIHKFSTIFLEGVPLFSMEILDSLRRFITFIDCAYDQNIELFLLAEGSVNSIFSAVQNSGLPTERALSRLRELTGNKNID
jgi:predicted ATPase